MCKSKYTQLLQELISFALLFVCTFLLGGCWGRRYQWALIGLVDHGLESIDELNFKNGAGMLMIKTSEGYWAGRLKSHSFSMRK